MRGEWNSANGRLGEPRYPGNPTVLRCRLQTQEAHLAAKDSLALATCLRTEVQHLRSKLADLESIVMRELVQDLPIEDLRTKKTKKEPPSHNRSKTYSPRKGDVLTVTRLRHRPMKKGPQRRKLIHRTMKRGL
jgi:hypothetical protein